MNASPLKNLVIVGANATGWTAAFVLAKYLKGLNVNIKVIDCKSSEETCRAGSFLPESSAFLQVLGLPLQELMKATRATFKLGSQYNDWLTPGHSHFQPFGPHGVQSGFIDFHNLAIKLRQLGDTSSLNDYSLAAKAATAGKFGIANNQKDPLLANFTFGIHFDVNRYADTLEGKAKNLGVEKVQGEVTSIAEDAFYFDCSGSQALLIDKQLNVGFEDWSDLLPCDRIATSRYSSDPSQPQTELTAFSNGFKRKIPMQGDGEQTYVYSSKYEQDKQPDSQLLNVGVRTHFWQKNCVALGEAAGLLDPMEIGQFDMVITALRRFMKLYPNSNHAVNAVEYNRQTRAEYELVRDYHLLRYKLTQRDDSPFWLACQNIELPDSLAHALALFKSHGRQPDYQQDLIGKHNWVSAFAGQGVWPENCHPLTDMLEIDKVTHNLAQMRKTITKMAGAMPDQQQFISRFCPS